MIYKRIVGIILVIVVAGMVVALAPLRGATATSNSKIVFTESTNSGNQIFTMFPDGTEVTHLTAGAEAQISPDGSQIVYMSYNSPIAGCGADRSVPNSNIYVMNVDGSNVRNLTGNMQCGLYITPSWSPDGSKIAYTIEGTPGTSSSLQQGIHIMNADGGGDTYLNVSGFPAWSPDGTELAYSNSTLHLINTDGDQQ